MFLLMVKSPQRDIAPQGQVFAPSDMDLSPQAEDLAPLSHSMPSQYYNGAINLIQAELIHNPNLSCQKIKRYSER